MTSQNAADVAALTERVKALEAELDTLRRAAAAPAADGAAIRVSEITIRWNPESGVCDFGGLPVAMLWVDTTLAGLMAGVQTMVGTERFLLALQSEGRKSVEADWQIISQAPTFAEGFAAISTIAAVAGWGRWELVADEEDPPRTVFRVHDGWEGRYQRTLGVRWGSGMVAGKLAGYCTRRFGTNCWAEQTQFIAAGDAWDEFEVTPSARSLELEIEGLLAADEATRADMAVALEKLRQEIAERQRADAALQRAREELERRVAERTEELGRALDRLRASEEQFRSVVESSPMGVHIYRLEGDRLVFTGANPTANAILGVDCAQFVGLTLEEAFPPLAQTEVPARYRAVCREGTLWTTRHLQYEDGVIRGCYDVTVFRTAPDTIAVLFVDITDQELARHEKERLLEQLHRARRMEALGLLAGGVAHDLNNILSGVVSYPDLLLADLPPGDPMVEPLQVIAESGQRAADVVQDLLTIARGSASHRQVVDLSQIVAGYLGSPELASLRVTCPGVAVEARLSDRPLLLRASPGHVRKALMNLVTNAVEACTGSRGGDSVTVRTEARYVDRPLQGYDAVSIGEYAVLTVEDKGPGIPQADLERIFEPFYTKKVLGRSGTGLGLTVVWNTVHDHDGYIHLESDAQGTRFALFFPAAPAESLPEEAPPVALARGRGERVLVVDDEPRQREIACRMLTRLGYQAAAAESGEAALAQLEGQPVDVLLLDMVMPEGWSGRETYQRVLERWPGQRAVIASGFAETDDVRATQGAGAGPFLRKPYTLAQLGAALRAELDRKR